MANVRQFKFPFDGKSSAGNSINSGGSRIAKIQRKIRQGLFLYFLSERVGDFMAVFGIRTNLSIVFEEKPSGDECPVSTAASYIVAPLGPAEMHEVAAIEGYEYTADQLVERLHGGSVCLGMRIDGEVVAVTWAYLGENAPNNFPRPLNRKEVLLFDAFTSNACRGMNLMPVLRYHLYLHLQELGRTTYFSTTDYFNSSAQKFKIKLGARRNALTFYVSLFNRWQRVFLLRRY